MSGSMVPVTKRNGAAISGHSNCPLTNAASDLPTMPGWCHIVRVAHCKLPATHSLTSVATPDGTYRISNVATPIFCASKVEQVQADLMEQQRMYTEPRTKRACGALRLAAVDDRGVARCTPAPTSAIGEKRVVAQLARPGRHGRAHLLTMGRSGRQDDAFFARRPS